MNYLQIFAKGGLTEAQRIEGEQNAENLLDVLQAIGIDTEQAVNVLNNLKDSPEIISQISDYANAVNDPSSSEELRYAAVEELLKIFKPSMFKCGGKLQQLVSKFGKGGDIDCGCGEKKLQPGGRVPKVLQGSTPTRSAALAGLRTVRVPDLENVKNRRVGAVRDNEGGLHLFEEGVVNGTSAQTAVNIHPGDTVITQNVLRRAGWDPRTYVRGDDQYELIMQRMRPLVNGVPYKQEGGNIELTELPGHDVSTNLTRRQARQLAAQNQGYNKAQFSIAMSNAMNAMRNQGLRGKELRERAREIAAGITPVQQSIVSAPTQLVGATETPVGFGNIVGIKEGDLRPQIPIVRPIIASAKPAKRGVIEVGNVSVDGTPSSTVGSNSPVTPIKRKGLDGTAVSIDSGVWGIDGTPLGRLYTENIPEQPHVVRSGRDTNGNYYEVSDGMAGIDINGNYYIKTIIPPKKKAATPATVPAGGGSFSWMSFKCGGKVEADKCGGKAKAKKAECGIKLKPAMKCGGKTKKKK